MGNIRAAMQNRITGKQKREGKRHTLVEFGTAQYVTVCSIEKALTSFDVYRESFDKLWKVDKLWMFHPLHFRKSLIPVGPQSENTAFPETFEREKQGSPSKLS